MLYEDLETKWKQKLTGSMNGYITKCFEHSLTTSVDEKFQRWLTTRSTEIGELFYYDSNPSDEKEDSLIYDDELVEDCRERFYKTHDTFTKKSLSDVDVMEFNKMLEEINVKVKNEGEKILEEYGQIVLLLSNYYYLSLFFDKFWGNKTNREKMLELTDSLGFRIKRFDEIGLCFVVKS